jgi:hypothetical protein
MRIDYSLVARAQKLAGAHIHEVNNWLTLYTGACALVALGQVEQLKVALQYERKLRSFVAVQATRFRSRDQGRS